MDKLGATTMHALRTTALSLLLGSLSCAPTAITSATPAALWTGKAHFEEVGTLDWKTASGPSSEQAGSFTVRNGTWYAFNRNLISDPVADCTRDHAGIVVRASRDQGRTWSASVPAVNPGASKAGDGCAVLDSSVYHDAATATWHMLAQCLDRQNTSGWAMCHYTRVGPSPMGRFIADPANPVVVGGQLWKQICAGAGKACPATVTDEGTPDIVEKRDGLFVMTIHGYDSALRQGYRGVVATSDFRQWQVRGNGLPDDAILGPRDCAAWMNACAGVGEATALVLPNTLYMVIETMDKSLECVPGQNWVFQIVKTQRGRWPRSGGAGWQRLPSGPLLTPAYRNAATPCAVQYARWIHDDTGIYLVYEDWGPKHAFVKRRLLKLVKGAGPVVQIAR
jgi:hypothetical protein